MSMADNWSSPANNKGEVSLLLSLASCSFADNSTVCVHPRLLLNFFDCLGNSTVRLHLLRIVYSLVLFTLRLFESNYFLDQFTLRLCLLFVYFDFALKASF